MAASLEKVVREAEVPEHLRAALGGCERGTPWSLQFTAREEAAWSSFCARAASAWDEPPSGEGSGAGGALRFAVGDRVRASNSHEGYVDAVVTATWYRRPEWPPSFVAAYQLALGDGADAESVPEDDRLLAPLDARAFVVGRDEEPPTQAENDADPIFDVGYPEEEGTRSAWQETGYTNLHLCCMRGITGGGGADVLRRLVRRPIHNLQTPAGPSRETPLHVAAMYGDEEAVEVLLMAGANPLAVDALGNTALAANRTGTPLAENVDAATRRRIHVLLARAVLDAMGPEGGDGDEGEAAH